MNVDSGVEIVKKNSGHIIFKSNGKSICVEPSAPDYAEWAWLYNNLFHRNESDRPSVYQACITNGIEPLKSFFDNVSASGEVAEDVPEPTSEEKLREALEKLINFFKEFEFEPNFRFVNTLSFKAKENDDCAKDFIKNYFSLVDNSYKTEVANKVNSMEFKEILNSLRENSNPQSHINTRFAVYYGSAGTGKTTLAMDEANNRCIVCNASMLPSDLMEDFVFAEGKPTFQKSVLWNCMENGLPIVLDEINLLPFDSLRFLQGILDGKKEFDYKGHKVTIADGFKVIGTMNLTIGGMVYGLPEPLIDRCADMRQFKLSADQLLGAVI